MQKAGMALQPERTVPIATGVHESQEVQAPYALVANPCYTLGLWKFVEGFEQ